MKDIESLVNTVHRFSCDIGMRFGVEKRGVIIMKLGKMVTCDGIEQPDGEKMKDVNEEGSKVFGFSRTIWDKGKGNEVGMQEGIQAKDQTYIDITLEQWNAISVTNIWAIAVIRYGAGILK